MTQSSGKRALITGITGQDGSYLTELLLAKGYEVHGVIRRSSSFNTERLDHIYQDPHQSGTRLRLHYGDLTDGACLRDIISRTKPHEIYNLGASQSHVRVSFDQPVYTVQTDALGTLLILKKPCATTANRSASTRPPVPKCLARSWKRPKKNPPPSIPAPLTPAARSTAFWQIVNYRESYNMYACNGILFNHESPRRGETFVTRKVTRAATRIKLGLQDKLFLGNLDAKRDWGFAGDYVEAMWLMLQQDSPDDYVIATGETHSIREFIEETFGILGLDWKKHVETDPRYFRPAEVDLLLGDPAKAKASWKWEPKVKFTGTGQNDGGLRPPAWPNAKKVLRDHEQKKRS